MQYISGIYALNIPCSLNTTGDWHASALQWNHLKYKESQDTFFGDWGIEPNHIVPEHHGTFAVANHLRACLDMLEDGDFSNLKGMYHDYLGNDIYLPVLFEKVWSMRCLPNWHTIDCFMEKEFLIKWIKFKHQCKKIFC